MKKENILFAFAGLFIGLVIGFFAANSINRNAATQPVVAQSQPNAPLINQTANQPNQLGGMIPDVQEKLDKANNEPENFAAQMSGGYVCQIGRYDKAFEFYEKGVQLKPDNSGECSACQCYSTANSLKMREILHKALEINPKDTTPALI